MEEKKQFVVTGIGTDVGKTVVSAIIAESLKADYWKPIQSGELDNSDSMKINRLTSDEVHVLAENFLLNQPLSPHASAAIDGVEIKTESLNLPNTNRNLVIEGAGGLMVPLNKSELLIDAFQQWNLPLIVVSRHYVGSINHTLLTIEALQNRSIPIHGLVFVGEENSASESFILSKSKLKMLIRIPIVSEVTFEFVQDQAKRLQNLNCL